MTRERWQLLMRDDDAKLTTAEMMLGWHFYHEFDGLIVGPGMGEMASCTCNLITHPDDEGHG